MTAINPYARYWEPYSPPDGADSDPTTTNTPQRPVGTNPPPTDTRDPIDTITVSNPFGSQPQPFSYSALSDRQLRFLADLLAAQHQEGNASSDTGGLVAATEIVVITAPRALSYQHLLAYGGLTGADENFQRDMSFAMAGLEERASRLGMNAHDEQVVGRDGDGVTLLDLNEVDTDLTLDPIGTYFSAPVTSPAFARLGITDFDLSRNKANHIDNNHFQSIPGKSQFAPNLRSHEALVANVIVPALQNPYRIHFKTNSVNSNGQMEVEVFGNLPSVAGTDTFGTSTRSVKISMWWTPGSSTLQVRNAFPVTQGRGQ